MSSDQPEYAARIMRVDLTTGYISVEKIASTDLRKCIGGYALGAKYLYDEVPASVEWDHPENRLLVLSGILGGTLIPGSGGVTICARGAMTGGAAATQAQGDFGAYLRRCGLLGIILHGVSPNWSYLTIDENGEAQLRDAQHILGMDTWDTVDAVVSDWGKRERDISVLCIGPAGERLVRWAGVIGNRGHTAGHNGVGAVMGSKKLKAVAVQRGKTPVYVADPKQLKAISERLMVPVKAIKDGIHYYGTLGGIYRSTEAGNLPVKNYTTSVWNIAEDEYEKFAAPYIHEHFEFARLRPCWACPNVHCQMMTIAQDPYSGLKMEEPEYEQLAAFSANLGINDVNSAMMLANTADRLGLDANEASWVCSLVMECFDRGILTSEDVDGLQMSWGAVDDTKELLRRIASREGIGDILADGVRLAVQEIGRDAAEIGIFTLKGVTPRSHDHRARWTELFDLCVSESGALENLIVRRIDLTQFGLPAKIHPYDPDMIAKAEAIMKGAMQLEDSAVTCRFNTNMNVGALSESIAAVTGWNFTFEEGMQVGRRAVNVMRVFNIRCGILAELDKPSTRYGSAPTDGPAQGHNIGHHFEQMLKMYYDQMGWDTAGKPLPETLEALGLERITSDLWGHAAKTVTDPQE